MMRVFSRPLIAAALATCAFASHAADDDTLPSTMIWTAYNVGSAGYANASAVADAFGKAYGTRIRIQPSSTAIGRLRPVVNERADLGFLSSGTFFATEGIIDFADAFMSIPLAMEECRFNCADLPLPMSVGRAPLHAAEPPDLRLALGAPTVHRRPLREPLSGDRLPLRRGSVHRVEPLDHVRRAEPLRAPLLKLLNRALPPDGLAERRLRHPAATAQGGEPKLERVLLICHSTSVNAHANPVNFLAQPRILWLTPGADSGIPQSVGSPRRSPSWCSSWGEGC